MSSVSQECSFHLLGIMDYMKNRLGLVWRDCSCVSYTNNLFPPTTQIFVPAFKVCTQQCQQQVSCWFHRHSMGLGGIEITCFKGKSAQSIPFMQRSSSAPAGAKLLQKQSLLSSLVVLFNLLLWDATVSHWVSVLPRQHYRRMGAESIKKLRKHSFYYRVVLGIDPSGSPVASVLFYLPMGGALVKAVWMQEPISRNLILNGPQANWENKDRQGHHVDRWAHGILELCSA